MGHTLMHGTHTDTWTHEHIRIKYHMETLRHMGREETHPEAWLHADTWSHEYQRTQVVTWTLTDTCTHADTP